MHKWKELYSLLKNQNKKRNANDINITIKNDEPRYSFFEVIVNDFFSVYIKNYLEKKGIDIDYSKSIIFRGHAEEYSMNVFLNYYVYNSNEKVYFYIKTYYGQTDIYEYS